MGIGRIERQDRKQPADLPGALVIGGDFQGLGVLQSLARHGVRTLLIDNELSIGRFSRYKGKMRACPSVRDEKGFVSFLTALASEESLRGWVVYPNNDETVRVLSRHKDELESVYTVPVGPWDRVKHIYDKRLTYGLAERVGVAIPVTRYPLNSDALAGIDLEFPVIVKPAIRDHFYARTKCKAVKAETKDELARAYEWASGIVPPSEVMVQELIPAGTSGLFSLGALFKEGRLLAKVVARRLRQHPVDFGHATTYALTVDIPELEELGARVLAAAGYYGLAEVEFMRDPRDDKFKLLEINARVWGWHTLGRAAGIDLPYLLYLDAAGMRVPPMEQPGQGVKWLRPITDVPTAMGEIMRGRMGAAEYLGTLRGCRELAPPLCLDDPLPFLMEFVIAPYLWKKRGF
ncbi:MAG: ATP-grasp domain-containing protein [Actinobacteria bacterium]|nr:MAG: ATP-grasp domain-containing protein [Actinomycetota bacterium]